MKSFATFLFVCCAFTSFCQVVPLSYSYPLNGNLDQADGTPFELPSTPPISAGPDREGHPHCAVRIDPSHNRQLPAAVTTFKTDTFSFSLWFKAESAKTNVLRTQFCETHAGKVIGRYVSFLDIKEEDTLLLLGQFMTGIVQKEWNHVAWTYSSGENVLYINGQKKLENYFRFPTGAEFKDHNCFSTQLFSNLNGFLDDFWQYNYVISPDQVSNLFQAAPLCDFTTRFEEDKLFRSHITLSPNPSNGSFDIVSALPLLQYEILNLQGQIIRQGRETHVDQLVPGMYLLQVTTQEGTQKKQLVVQ